MRKAVLAGIVGIGSLAGCVAVWGDAYNVALKNSNSIVIEYDRALVNMVTILNVAQEHCNEFSKDALFQSQTEGNIGIYVNTYECVAR